MLSTSQSTRYFLLGCIPLRVAIALLPLYVSKNTLTYYSIPLFAIAISFLFLYFTHGRQHAFEAGGATWWANYRLLHGLLYLAAAIYAFNQSRTAWIPLTIDVFLGLALFVHKRLA